MKLKRILGWALLAATLFFASCSWLQDEYFFTYSTDPGLSQPLPSSQPWSPRKP